MTYIEARQKMAEQVRTAMFAKNMTVAELAEKAAVSRDMIVSLRTCKGNPSFTNIYAVFTALGITEIQL